MERRPEWEREYARMWRQERRFLQKGREARPPLLNRKLEPLVPDRLRETLLNAFSKAFALVFARGIGAIERAYGRPKRERDYLLRRYAAELERPEGRPLRGFSRAAAAAGRGNVLLSGAGGVGLGLLGAGLPDAPLFSAVVLKGLYETAVSFGFGYETPEEKAFLLRLISAALSHGAELEERNAALNAFIQAGRWPEPVDLDAEIAGAARSLAEELLYMKFLQGVPVAGAVGGAYDAVCQRRILRYAGLKYQRRFLLEEGLRQAAQ